MVPALALSVMLLAAAAGAQPDGPADGVVEPLVVESSSGAMVEGRLDWTAGTITVTGEGVAPEDVTHPVQRRLLGFRAAKLVAYRTLLEVVGGVQVDARTTVSMSMVASDSVRARVEGMVRGARVVPGSQREEDGLFRLDLRLDLHGPLAEAVLPDTGGVAPSLPEELPDLDSVIVFVPPKPFTGLVVDARGTSLSPSLSPRIVDDSGRVIYAAAQADHDQVVRDGVVAYERDLQRAATNPRVGGEAGHPFLVQAIGVSGLYNADVVVTRDMGTRIRMADMDGDFLERCGVVFVVGPKPVAPQPVFSTAATADSNGHLDATGALPQPDFLDSILEARAGETGLAPETP